MPPEALQSVPRSWKTTNVETKNVESVPYLQSIVRCNFFPGAFHSPHTTTIRTPYTVAALLILQAMQNTHLVKNGNYAEATVHHFGHGCSPRFPPV